MNSFTRGPRKSENQPDGAPANKKPRSDYTNGSCLEDDDDPFADDITGEEWEYAASQAELQHSEQNQPNQTGESTPFKQPQPPLGQNRNDQDSKLNSALKSKLSIYETKVAELQSSFNRKQGETLLLRDRLSNLEKQLNQEKIKVIEMQSIQEKQDLERTKFAQKQIEKCKDEVQFKQAELQESQNFIRNLESKIKSLEQQNSTLKSRSPVKLLVTNGEGLKGEMSTSQTEKRVATTSNVKRIKLVKPESPRISSKSVINAKFPDKPLEKSNATDSSHPGYENLVSMTLPQRWKLRSKLLQHGNRGHSILQGIIRENDSLPIPAKESIPSIFQIISSEVTRNSNATRSLSENLKRYLSTIPESMTLFDNFHSVSYVDDASGLLNVIKNHINAFASFQDVSPTEDNPTTDSSSYHTALTQQENAGGVKTCSKIFGKKVNVICQNALSSLHILLIICEHLPKVCHSKENRDLLSVLGRLCNVARWNPKTVSKDDILLLIIKILTIHAPDSEKSIHFKIYEEIVKTDTLLPLITHKNVRLQCRALDLLNALVSYHPAFAVHIVQSQNDRASILCHITDLMGMQLDLNSESRFKLLMKSLQFLSNLVANHQSLLIEHSCFSEIYNAADSLLYSELRSWKRDCNEMRQSVIKSALCLLHSCVSVYPDSIPGSRRLHSHQFTMILLREFFHENFDKPSFWNEELGRIIETEVKSVLEEGDSS